MKLMYLITRYSAFVEGGVVITREFPELSFSQTRSYPALSELTIPGDWYVGCSLTFKINACTSATYQITPVISDRPVI